MTESDAIMAVQALCTRIPAARIPEQTARVWAHDLSRQLPGATRVDAMRAGEVLAAGMERPQDLTYAAIKRAVLGEVMQRRSTQHALPSGERMSPDAVATVRRAVEVMKTHGTQAGFRWLAEEMSDDGK